MRHMAHYNRYMRREKTLSKAPEKENDHEKRKGVWSLGKRNMDRNQGIQKSQCSSMVSKQRYQRQSKRRDKTK